MEVYLSIGGNLGNRSEILEETREFIQWNFGDIESTSKEYETEPWEMVNVPPFLNQVIKIRTDLSPEELLSEIKELDEFYGRKRKKGSYTSREMDIDILFYGNEVIDNEKMQVPHPRMHLRKFVLVPMNEIAPLFEHPVLKKTIAQLLDECTDQSSVKLL